jgi:hypothetical protein
MEQSHKRNISLSKCSMSGVNYRCLKDAAEDEGFPHIAMSWAWIMKRNCFYEIITYHRFQVMIHLLRGGTPLWECRDCLSLALSG